MTIEIDRTSAMTTLRLSRERCIEKSIDDCEIKGTIDFVLSAKSSLTYRYIMFTALTAKATNEDVDILSLQASDDSPGAYDARSLCHSVVYPFQQNFLGDTVDGSNNDPLVNKPGRYPRLSTRNAAANGDPKKVLSLLCSDLPKVATSDIAENCLDYLVSRLLKLERKNADLKSRFDVVAADSTISETRAFLDELLGKGFGGAALVMVAAALYGVMYPESDGYKILPHPANQAGTSSKQASDLDVLKNGSLWLATELKDKPFTDSDVSHAVDTAYRAGVKRLLFVAGRQSTIDEQRSAYFEDVRSQWMERGLYIGVMPIDALMDFVFATFDIDTRSVFSSVQRAADAVKSIEASMWVYGRVSDLKKES